MSQAQQDFDMVAEYEAYLANKAEYLYKYGGHFIALQHGNVLAVEDSRIDAIVAANQTYELGTFLVVEVKEKEDSHVFHGSRLKV